MLTFIFESIRADTDRAGRAQAGMRMRTMMKVIGIVLVVRTRVGAGSQRRTVGGIQHCIHAGVEGSMQGWGMKVCLVTAAIADAETKSISAEGKTDWLRAGKRSYSERPRGGIARDQLQLSSDDDCSVETEGIQSFGMIQM